MALTGFLSGLVQNAAAGRAGYMKGRREEEGAQRAETRADRAQDLQSRTLEDHEADRTMMRDRQKRIDELNAGLISRRMDAEAAAEHEREARTANVTTKTQNLKKGRTEQGGDPNKPARGRAMPRATNQDKYHTRVEELVKGGMARDKAVEQATDEYKVGGSKGHQTRTQLMIADSLAANRKAKGTAGAKPNAAATATPPKKDAGGNVVLPNDDNDDQY